MILTPAALSYLFGQFKAFALSFIPKKEEVKSELTKHQNDVINAIKRLPIDYRNHGMKLASALLQFDFSPYFAASNSNDFKPGMIVVPIQETGGHDYPLNVPCAIYEGTRGLRLDGTLGNHLPSLNDSSSIRFATPEEIDTFFAAMSKPEILRQDYVMAFIRNAIAKNEIEIVA